ncbi:2Fe-2S iron-sulfur cluster-binding protein [Methylocella tundrae]|uniref:Ferredoxin n=1 Tax=Methylocella tundrae TaxID=227605 RepID=A0A4U8Z5G2_METTU|nr:2Fe-2S iron-sulfur cluster-binding protein [Methylocella tundrae]WPP04408.1 2Fe-2S iron-sulfur cluster-binding protein [Methylocella tundrae]VFU10768.1 Ferredoxin [Methylocella tundrae]
MAPLLIQVLNVDQPFRCGPDETVLRALAPIHHDRIGSGCHGGGCGVCRIRVLQGDYVVGCMSRAHVSIEEEASGLTLACRTWPRSDLAVEPVGKLPARLMRRFRLLPPMNDDRVQSPDDREK